MFESFLHATMVEPSAETATELQYCECGMPRESQLEPPSTLTLRGPPCAPSAATIFMPVAERLTEVQEVEVPGKVAPYQLAP